MDQASMSSSPPAPRSYLFELPVPDFLHRQDAIFHTAAKALASADKEIYGTFSLLLVDRRLPSGRVGNARWRLLGARGSAFCVFLELTINWVHGWHPRCKIVLNTVLPAPVIEPLVRRITKEPEKGEPWQQVQNSERRSMAGVIAAGIGRPVTLVETSPVVAIPTRRSVICHRPDEQLLVLKPSRFWGLFSLPVLLLLVFVAGLTLMPPLLAVFWTIKNGPLTGLWFGGGIAVVLLLFFAFSLFLAFSLGVGCCFEFDKNAGWMRRGWDVAGYGIGMRQMCLLREALLVQLIEVSRPSRRARTYQVNLVLDDRRPRRINVSEQINLERTRQTARDLAAFLGIPLLDEFLG
jgi:hypothetical protein